MSGAFSHQAILRMDHLFDIEKYQVSKMDNYEKHMIWIIL